MLDMEEGVLCEELLLAVPLLAGKSTSTSTPNPVDATIAMLVRTCIHACASMHMDHYETSRPNTCHPHCMQMPFPIGWRLVQQQTMGNPTPHLNIRPGKDWALTNSCQTSTPSPVSATFDSASTRRSACCAMMGWYAARLEGLKAGAQAALAQPTGQQYAERCSQW